MKQTGCALYFFPAIFQQNVNATHEAIAKGDVAKLRELAAVDENYLRARDEFGCHPIHAAIESRQLEAARLILQKFPTSINLKATVSEFTQIITSWSKKQKSHISDFLIKK